MKHCGKKVCEATLHGEDLGIELRAASQLIHTQLFAIEQTKSLYEAKRLAGLMQTAAALIHRVAEDLIGRGEE